MNTPVTCLQSKSRFEGRQAMKTAILIAILALSVFVAGAALADESRTGDAGAAAGGTSVSPDWTVQQAPMTASKLNVSYPARRQFCDRFLGLMDQAFRRHNPNEDFDNNPGYQRERRRARSGCVRAFDTPGIARKQYNCLNTLRRLEDVRECGRGVVPFIQAFGK